MAKMAFSSASKKPIPAYQRIKNSILESIHKGLWQAGEAIPTEHALAEHFNVSRMTVNRALKELSEERVLQRRQGSGTFVAQQQFNHTFVEVRNIAEDIKSNGQQYKVQVVSQKRMLVDEVETVILSRFNIKMLNNVDKAKTTNLVHDDNDVIDEVKIIHIADAMPIQFEERWVNAKIVPEFIEQDFNIINTSDYLIQKVPLQGGSYTITALAATAEVASALDIEEGAPTLLLSRQTYSAGRVVTFVNMWHAGDRYQFSGTL